MSLPSFKPVLILPLLCSGAANAVTLIDSVDINGFIGIGGSYNLNRDDAYQNLIESGLKVHVALPKNVAFNGQLLYRDFNNPTPAELDVDYATLDWSFTQGESENTVSIGRFKANGGIYSNTRDMPFTRPSIFLAQAIYSESYRSLYDHIDGLRFQSVLATDWGDFSAELGYGKSNFDESFNTAVLAGAPAHSTIEADDSLVVDLRFRTFSWLTSFTYRHVEVTFDVSDDFFNSQGADTDGPNPFLDLNGDMQISTDLKLESYTLGLQYLRDKLELTAEGNLQTITIAACSDLYVDTYGYYVQGRYFFTPELALMLRYDWQYEDTDELALLGPPDAKVKPGGEFDDQKSEILSVGTTWNFKENWQLAVEGHRMLGQDTLGLVQLAWRF